VKLLIDAGADVNVADKYGRTPLYWASRNGFNGCAECVKYHIDAGADVNIADKDGETPLYWASHNGHTDSVKRLIDAGANVNNADNNGRTPLYWASYKGYTDSVKRLIDAGAVPPVSMSISNRYGVNIEYLPMVYIFVNGEVKELSSASIRELIMQHSVKCVQQ
jgi:ankyrin repeat protein